MALSDVQAALMNVRFEGKNGHDAGAIPCPLMTQSGHLARGPALRPRPVGNHLSTTHILLGRLYPRANRQAGLSHEWYRLL